MPQSSQLCIRASESSSGSPSLSYYSFQHLLQAQPILQYQAGLAHVQLPPPRWTEPVAPKLATEERAAARAKQGHL